MMPIVSMEPGYIALFNSGELECRANALEERLASCDICPRECHVNRLQNELGFCHSGHLPIVSAVCAHHGEEPVISGSRGSGTIFFSYCNLRCMFCQNYSISQLGQGRVATKGEIAKMMLALEERGCHNINLVTPTHVVPQILEALEIAVGLGLSIPLVYNCGGYESVETLELLDGIVDIYMPDMKYSNERNARRFSGVKDYPEANRAAVKEMHRQVGDLQIDERGVARRGLLIRHLVLPNGVAGTEGVVRFIAEEISRNTYLNVMAQYYPAHRAFKLPALSRPLRNEEFLEAVNIARGHGLERLDGARPMARQV